MASASGAVAAALRPIAAVAVPASISAGQNVVLQAGGSAAACGRNVATYAWSIVNPGAAPPGISGANTSTATVLAPATGSFAVRLTVTDDAGRTDSADTVITATTASTAAPASAGSSSCLPAITLTSSGAIAVTVAPSSANIAVKNVLTFSATVTNTGILPVTWQVNGITGGNATVGTISSAGVYTAPASMPSPAVVTVTAISTALTTATASAQVTIGTVFPVTISPTSATLAGSGTQSFSATVAAVASSAVTWQVNGIAGGNTTVGTISSTGLYTAPATAPSPATVTVTAIAQADSSSNASAQVTITAPVVTTSTAGSSSGGGGGGGGSFDGLALLLLAAMIARALFRGDRAPPASTAEIPDRPATRPFPTAS
jgi:hypothetical protein